MASGLRLASGALIFALAGCGWIGTWARFDHASGGAPGATTAERQVCGAHDYLADWPLARAASLPGGTLGLSPDGEALYQDGGSLYLYRQAAMPWKLRAVPPGSTVSQFNWSADGKELLLTYVAATGGVSGSTQGSSVASSLGQMVLVDSIDGSMRSIGSPGFALQASLSPDGRSVLFSVGNSHLSAQFSKPGLYVLNLDTSSTRSISPTAVLARTTWAPDSSHFAFLEVGGGGGAHLAIGDVAGRVDTFGPVDPSTALFWNSSSSQVNSLQAAAGPSITEISFPAGGGATATASFEMPDPRFGPREFLPAPGGSVVVFEMSPAQVGNFSIGTYSLDLASGQIQEVAPPANLVSWADATHFLAQPAGPVGTATRHYLVQLPPIGRGVGTLPSTQSVLAEIQGPPGCLQAS